MDIVEFDPALKGNPCYYKFSLETEKPIPLSRPVLNEAAVTYHRSDLGHYVIVTDGYNMASFQQPQWDTLMKILYNEEFDNDGLRKILHDAFCFPVDETLALAFYRAAFTGELFPESDPNILEFPAKRG